MSALSCPRCGGRLAMAKIIAGRVEVAFPDWTPDAVTTVRYCPADDLVVLVRDGQVVDVEGDATGTDQP